MSQTPGNTASRPKSAAQGDAFGDGLAEVVRAWPELSADVQALILATVRESVGGRVVDS